MLVKVGPGVRLTTHSSCGHWSTTAASMAVWSWPPTCHCKLVSSNVLVPLNHNIVISACSWFLHMPMVSSMCRLHVYDIRLWMKYWWDLLIVIAPGLFHQVIDYSVFKPAHYERWNRIMSISLMKPFNYAYLYVSHEAQQSFKLQTFKVLRCAFFSIIYDL